jgi:hypothetical protein
MLEERRGDWVVIMPSTVQHQPSTYLLLLTSCSCSCGARSGQLIRGAPEVCKELACMQSHMQCMRGLITCSMLCSVYSSGPAVPAIAAQAHADWINTMRSAYNENHLLLAGRGQRRG